MKTKMTVDRAIEIARRYAPQNAVRVRVSWDGEAQYDIDIEQGYAYPPYRFSDSSIDFYVHGGESRGSRKLPAVLAGAFMLTLMAPAIGLVGITVLALTKCSFG